MKGRFIAAVLAALCALPSAFFIGCAEEEVQPAGEANVKWDLQSGAEYYDVYRAQSRFGDYQLIASGLREGQFYDSEYAESNYYKIVAVSSEGELGEQLTGGELELFGENTYILSPDDDPAEVQALINDIYSMQEDAHFGDRRFAVYFKPGAYADGIDISVGYYTTFSGLGRTADDVSLMRMRCTDTWNTNALINFWRGAENLTLRNDLTWSVSQGTYLRGVNIKGNASLWHTGASSGGFMANCDILGTVTSGSQQQWLSRNSRWKNWNGALWNMVFLGNEEGCAPESGWADGAWNTVIEETPVIREKPYLIYEGGEYSVFVPSLETDCAGMYDAETDVGAEIIPLSDFYVAKEGDTAEQLNAALSQGKNLFFTPGIYSLSAPLQIVEDGTVVLGTGLATLVPDNGEGCMIAETAENITIAGLLFDAADSDYLLKVGADGKESGNAEAPALIADCFFRVGGVSDENTRADTCLVINSDGVVMDNIWAWRADHGYRWRESQNTLAGVGWDVNKSQTGVAVYGDNVTAYGLFSEHFQGHNVLWAGNNGDVVFFQSEIAYDIPSSEGSADTSQFISFYIEDGVKNFSASAMGVYTHFWNGGIEIDCAVRTPQTEGIEIENVVAIALSTNNDSHLSGVIDNEGGFVGAGTSQVRVLSYIKN